MPRLLPPVSEIQAEKGNLESAVDFLPARNRIRGKHKRTAGSVWPPASRVDLGRETALVQFWEELLGGEKTAECGKKRLFSSEGRHRQFHLHHACGAHQATGDKRKTNLRLPDPFTQKLQLTGIASGWLNRGQIHQIARRHQTANNNRKPEAGKNFKNRRGVKQGVFEGNPSISLPSWRIHVAGLADNLTTST
ncbi:hypothetical protein K438DRAFT_1747546 [Mycena galopus ATCC 62051]|nr:hypothetical protein K438DRAFT_1747546 [Mycena galopus ATCC 62051]